jgi:hypothetical protein
MRIHRHIATLAATVAAIGAFTPVAGALAAPNRAGSAPTGSVAAHRVFAPRGPTEPGTGSCPSASGRRATTGC